MRRYVFYFAVALLAFGIGLLTVFKSYFNSEKNNIVNEKTEQSNIETINSQIQFNEQNLKLNSVKTKFQCEDEYLSVVWNHLQEDKDLKEIFDRGIEETGSLTDCEDVIGIDKLIDLNNDRENEAIVRGQGWLNGLNERRIWIVGKISGNYKIILDGNLADIEITENKTKGYCDLMEVEKISIPEYEKTLFQFTGKSYKARKCWTEIIAARDKNEMIYELKKPKKYFHSCLEK